MKVAKLSFSIWRANTGYGCVDFDLIYRLHLLTVQTVEITKSIEDQR